MKKFNILSTIVLIFALIAGYDSVYTVSEMEQVVLTQFGKPVGNSVVTPGIQFKTPFIQNVNRFEKRYIQWDGDPNEIPTSDKTFIWVDATARWRIVDPLLFLQRIGSVSRADSILSNLINGSLRDIITKNPLIEVLLSSDWKEEYLQTTERTRINESRSIKVGRNAFSSLVVQSTKQEMERNGIQLEDVLITKINYTEQVQERVFERMISERKRIAAELRSQGEGQKAEILGAMEKTLNEIQSEAMRTAEQTKGKGDAEAIAIGGRAYSRDAEFYKFWVTLQAYKRIVGPNTKLIIDINSDLYKYLVASQGN